MQGHRGAQRGGSRDPWVSLCPPPVPGVLHREVSAVSSLALPPSSKQPHSVLLSPAAVNPPASPLVEQPHQWHPACCTTAPAPHHGRAAGQLCCGGLHHEQHFLTVPTNSSQHCWENKPASGSTGTSLHSALIQWFPPTARWIRAWKHALANSVTCRQTELTAWGKSCFGSKETRAALQHCTLIAAHP